LGLSGVIRDVALFKNKYQLVYIRAYGFITNSQVENVDNIAFYLIYSNGNWTFVYDTSFKWEIESELDPGTYYTKFEINEKFEEIDGGEL